MKRLEEWQEKQRKRQRTEFSHSFSTTFLPQKKKKRKKKEDIYIIHDKAAHATSQA